MTVDLHRRAAIRRMLLPLIASFAVQALSSGCTDDEGPIFAMKLDELQILSAVPLVKGADGQPTPSCRVMPDDGIVGFDVSFVIAGAFTEWCCVGGAMTGPCKYSADGHDQDSAIRLWDFVQGPVYDGADPVPDDASLRQMRIAEDGAGGAGLGGDSFEMALDDASRVCLDGTIPCEGGLNAGSLVALSGTSIDWQAAYDEHAAAAGAPVRCAASRAAVAVLLDRSGSMAGWVDIDGGYVETQQHLAVAPSHRRALATDPMDYVLSAVLAKLIAALNPDDSLVLFTYVENSNDGSIQAVCDAEALKRAGTLTNEPEHVRKGLACHEAGLDSITTRMATMYPPEEGRTPLWEAVAAAYDFLNRPDVAAPYNRHIVVVGDGPDTCVESAEEFVHIDRETGKLNLPCSGVTYESVVQKVADDVQDPNVPPVRIHFVQLQAAGYMAPDPRQQELACLTRGQYLFINGRNLQSDPDESFRYLLEDALARIRRSLSGTWVLRALTDQLTDAQGGDAGLLADGRIYGLEGRITLRERLLSFEDRIADFRAQNSLRGSGGTREWPNDRRLLFRRACDPENQAACLPPGRTPDPCKDYCSPQRLICLDTPADKPEDTACVVAGTGSPGVCCSGVCEDRTSCC